MELSPHTLFLNIAWMKKYQGQTPEDNMLNGGDFVRKNQDGGEQLNFAPHAGVLYGYVRANKVNLERIDPLAKNAESVDDVLVIWTAVNPDERGTYIVGWYNHAIVFRERQQQPQRNIIPYTEEPFFSYFAKTTAEHATLLLPEERDFKMTRGKKGYMGQSQVWYAEEVPDYVQEIRNYIRNKEITKATKKSTERKVYEGSGTKLTVEQWKAVLQDPELTQEVDLAIFQTMYAFTNHAAFSQDVASILEAEYSSIVANSINFEIHRYADRIAEKVPVQFSKRKNGKNRYWVLFFNGWQEGKRYIWQLKEPLVIALENLGLTGNTNLPEELFPTSGASFSEGAKKTIQVNAYERDRKARNACIAHWGVRCQVCQLNFEDRYGSLGAGFIHVHHLTKIASIGKSYKVNPIEDLRPVCPNCHAMLHRRNPPLSIEELRSLLPAEPSTINSAQP